jgi:thermitase
MNRNAKETHKVGLSLAMFKLKKRIIPLILLILMLSVPIYGQEGTQEPAVPTEVITEAPTEIPTEAPTEVITEAPTEIPTEAPTEAATEDTVVTENPVTEEAVITEVPVVSTEETPVATEVTPIPTEAPLTNIRVTPAGEAVEMLLQYNPNASAESIAEMLAALGAVELERLPQIGFMRVLIPSSVSSLATAQSHLQGNDLAFTAGLMSVEPNDVWSVTFTPNDPLFGSQTNLRNDETLTTYSIFMESAWQTSPRDGQGVLVAVLDTGLDLQHPEFAGKFVAGWDFINDDNDPDDDQGHGTHVSGVIAARTNNGVGIAGMAYNAMILPVKVLDEFGDGYIYEIAAGIVYAVDRGAKVINMSLGGGGHSTTMEAAVNYALSRNVVVVAAAGNNGNNTSNTCCDATSEIMYPAYYTGVISVANMGIDGNTIYTTSNSNDNVTVAAPGTNILSTVPIEFGSYATATGTSMASPHVAALAAMLIADGLATTPAQVHENLRCTSFDRGVLGEDNLYGWGFIQADYSLTWLSNSSQCQVSIPNDHIHNAMTITNPPFSVMQAVSTRSVTESADDPLIGGNFAYQSLWYKFTPANSGQYIFSTYGSGSYDTMIGIYQGNPGELTEIASNNDLGIGNSHAFLRVSLVRNITYYVQVGTFGGDALSQFMQLNVNPAITSNTLQQENAAGIRYTGTWNRLATTGASGGYTMTTTDASATMSFLVRGTSLNISRMVGPTQADMQIFVDGVSLGIFGNSGAVSRISTISIPIGAVVGEWHLVMIRNGGGYASLRIDSLQVFDASLPTALVGATRLGESATAFSYPVAPWAVVGKPGALNGNVRETSTPSDYVQFRTSGTAITIFRSTGPGTGTMAIYIDGVLYDTVDNTLIPVPTLPASPSVPYTIPNLPQRERVIRVENVSGTLQFDGAQSVNQAFLTANVITDERSPNIVYSGIWTRSTVPSAQANAGTLSTATTTATDTARASFMMSGNHLCIAYQRFVGGGNIQVYLDGASLATISTNGTSGNKVEWCTYHAGVDLNILTDTAHTVDLVVGASQSVRLDYVRAVRRPVLISTSGYVTETNAAFTYTGIWATSTERSGGGYQFQGGSARRADVSLSGGQTVSFTMSGTGFILYTAIDVNGRAGAFEVNVDGVVETIVFNGANFNYLDTWDVRDFRFRPVGLGVTGLPVGIHHIVLEAIEPFPAQFVYFDGVRVLP